VLEIEGQKAQPPPSGCSLSSFNMFHLVEANSALQFEQALLAMDPNDTLDCRVLYLHRSNADDIEISDLPFPKSYSNTKDQILSHLDLDASLPPNQTNPSSPMSTLPSAPVLSVPQYVSSITETLDTYHPSLAPRFETLLTRFAADVFPDPPKLRLGPQRPEDMRIVEEPGSVPVWKKVYRLSPPQIIELKAQLTKMLEAGII
jgi:hypothetical protein